MIHESIMPSVVFWADEETPVIFYRWSGTIEITQRDQSIDLSENEIEPFIRALRMCAKKSYEQYPTKEAL